MRGHVQRLRPESAPVHWREHLPVAHGIEAEPLGDALGDDTEQPLLNFLGGVAANQIEIAVGTVGLGGFRALAGIDAMGVDDDPRGRGLTEHLGQTHGGDRSRVDQIGQHRARANRG